MTDDRDEPTVRERALEILREQRRVEAEHSAFVASLLRDDKHADLIDLFSTGTENSDT